MPKATTEEEQRAAEIAAKKSRLKQKLVKSARSVAIFSLKLKERRAKEAERLAKEKAEELAQEKVSNCIQGFSNSLLMLSFIRQCQLRGCAAVEANSTLYH